MEAKGEMNMVTALFALLVVAGAGLLLYGLSNPFSAIQSIAGVLLIAIAMLVDRFFPPKD